MLVEAGEGGANLGAVHVVGLTFDERRPVVAALVDSPIRCTAVHGAAQIRALLADALVVELLRLTGVKRVVHDTLDEDVRVGLEAQTSVRLANRAGSRPWVAEAVEDAVTPEGPAREGYEAVP